MTLSWCVVLLAFGVGGCTEVPTGSSGPVGTSVSPASTTTVVTRGDVTSVLVLSGVVRPGLALGVRAGAAGELVVLLPEGALVAEGSTIGTVAGVPVLAPADGVLGRWHVADGGVAPADLPVAEVRHTGFGVVLDVPVEDAYRLYRMPSDGIANITGGPGGLTCRVIPLSPVDDAPGDLLGTTTTTRFACLLPADAAVMDGLPAKVGLETASAEGVLTLPVEAVAGVTGTGVVARVDAAGTTSVHVTLGVSDGHVVEVRDGLVEGDRVLAYVPGLDW